jgi:predicted small metal-binding protein
VITADDEDELVAQVQNHAARDHNATHVLSRQHILARLHRLYDQNPEQD